MRKVVVLLIGALLTVVFIGTAAAATTWTVDAPVTVKESTDGFTISAGWQYEGKRIDEPYLFDVTVVRLDDGRYRLYGEASDIGDHTVVSYISSDGLNFQKEAGYRLTGAFMPFVVKLPDGRFRLYYTDQTGEPPAPGARAIKSAISDDGLNFVIVAGDRLTYTGISHESSGIRGSKILQLSDGSYRMYYHGIAGDSHWRVLSAVSPDGLSWTRESGVRLDPSDLCAAITRIGNVAPFITSDGVFHLYVSALVCDGDDFTNGILDCTSADGLTFTAGSTAVVESYGLQSEGTEVTPEDPAVIMTDNGLRMYFAPYGTTGSVISESGIYSIITEASPSVMITTDKYEYTAGDTMRLGLGVTNPLESAQHVNLKVYLEMLDGGTFSLLDTTVTLPAGLDYGKSNFKVLTLPSIPDDPYTWHAQLSNPVTGELISEDTAEWEFVSTEMSTGTEDITRVLDQATVAIDFGE